MTKHFEEMDAKTRAKLYREADASAAAVAAAARRPPSADDVEGLALHLVGAALFAWDHQRGGRVHAGRDARWTWRVVLETCARLGLEVPRMPLGLEAPEGVRFAKPSKLPGKRRDRKAAIVQAQAFAVANRNPAEGVHGRYWYECRGLPVPRGVA
jgi:hypothetical protein